MKGAHDARPTPISIPSSRQPPFCFSYYRAALHELTLCLQLGGYDEPAASSEASDPRLRRHRLREALEGTRDLDRNRPSAPVTLPLPSSEAHRRVYVAPSTRRRRRSDSVPQQGTRANLDLPATDDASDRRFKRRRLNNAPLSPRKPGIKYGYYGQVEPGRLKMDLVSCDGGEHRDPRYPATSLGPANLLKHDKSVYCSERPSTNVILRHADAHPFCLEKLHIVGPEHGFTAAYVSHNQYLSDRGLTFHRVREGLVYVSMTMMDLERYKDPPPHARLSGIHSPPYRRRRNRSSNASPERIGLSDALRDPEINAVLSEREHQNGRNADGLHDLASGESHHESDLDAEYAGVDPDCEDPSFDDISPRTRADDYANGAGRPITVLSDEEPGPEDTSSQDVLDYRLQRLRWARRRLEADRFDADDRWAGLSRLPPESIRDREAELAGSWGLNSLMARSHVHDPASPGRDTSVQPANPAADSYGAEEGLEDKHVTCARFHIKKNKCKVTIKFDPAVTGRFILLKLWANRSNVDVQSVIPMGYGSCRFFPAVSMR